MSEHSTLPSNEDRHREAVALRVQKIGPKGAPVHMTDGEYSVYSKQRRICQSNEVMLSAEEALRVVFCRACLKVERFLQVSAAQLLVRYENDPLKAVGTLAKVECHQCGFEMHVNMKRNPEAIHSSDLERYFQEISKTQIDPRLYSDHYRRMMEQNMAAQSAMQRQLLIDNARLTAMPPILVQQAGDSSLAGAKCPPPKTEPEFGVSVIERMKRLVHPNKP